MNEQALTRDHARRLEHDEARWARLPIERPADAMADQWGGWALQQALAA